MKDSNINLQTYYRSKVRNKAVCCALAFTAALVSALALPPNQHSGGKSATRTGQPELVPVSLPTEPGTYAVLYTSKGNIVCRLLEKSAPQAVSNFVGLAKGTKQWKDPETGKMRRLPLYSGTTFHRVIPGFMIQGGDPLGTGEGDPGYRFDDEIDPNRNFDQAGVLAMANSGPNTNGCQFFITVAPASHLNGHYSIFGEVVSGQEVAGAISEVPRDEENDKPLTPVKIIRIVIRKVPAPAAKP